MKRYAYLIMANKNPKQLQYLISALDDSRNDIYLLIDKKSKNFPNKFKANYSAIYYLNPINIYWGGYSQIRAELNLFAAAAPEHYEYYHLLSGLDLPLVNQDIIHNFFDSHQGLEFIKFKSMDKRDLVYINMRLEPHLLRKHLLSNNLLIKIIFKLQGFVLKQLPQYKIAQNQIGYGPNWVSIGDKLIQFIINHKNWINYIFSKGINVDELFIQTLIKENTYFKRKVYKSPDVSNNLRYIKFDNNKSLHPCTWRMSNLPQLINARSKGYLFSRKFDMTIDNNIVKKIFNHIMK